MIMKILMLAIAGLVVAILHTHAVFFVMPERMSLRKRVVIATPISLTIFIIFFIELLYPH